MKTKIKSYQMFTTAGDKACQSLVNKMERKIKGKKRLTEEEINRALWDGVSKVEAKHPEISDSEPSYMIWKQVVQFCEEVGYDYEIYI